MIDTKIVSPNASTSYKRLDGIVTTQVGNYEKHPFFVKKSNAAKAKIAKVGLPKMGEKKTS
jgi:hypothetical protein